MLWAGWGFHKKWNWKSTANISEHEHKNSYNGQSDMRGRNRNTFVSG